VQCIYELVLLSIGIRPGISGILTGQRRYIHFLNGPRRQNGRAPPVSTWRLATDASDLGVTDQDPTGSLLG
jgi:hypothetical protein